MILLLERRRYIDISRINLFQGRVGFLPTSVMSSELTSTLHVWSAYLLYSLLITIRFAKFAFLESYFLDIVLYAVTVTGCNLGWFFQNYLKAWMFFYMENEIHSAHLTATSKPSTWFAWQDVNINRSTKGSVIASVPTTGQTHTQVRTDSCAS